MAKPYEEPECKVCPTLGKEKGKGNNRDETWRQISRGPSQQSHTRTPASLTFSLESISLRRVSCKTLVNVDHRVSIQRSLIMETTSLGGCETAPSASVSCLVL